MKLPCCLGISRRFWVGIIQERLYGHQDCGDIVTGSPIGLRINTAPNAITYIKDVQADVAIRVDIRVEDFCEKTNFWWNLGILFSEGQRKLEGAPFPRRALRSNSRVRPTDGVLQVKENTPKNQGFPLEYVVLRHRGCSKASTCLLLHLLEISHKSAPTDVRTPVQAQYDTGLLCFYLLPSSLIIISQHKSNYSLDRNCKKLWASLTNKEAFQLNFIILFRTPRNQELWRKRPSHRFDVHMNLSTSAITFSSSTNSSFSSVSTLDRGLWRGRYSHGLKGSTASCLSCLSSSSNDFINLVFKEKTLR